MRRPIVHPVAATAAIYLLLLHGQHQFFAGLIVVDAVISSHYDESEHIFSAHRLHQLQQQQQKQQQQLQQQKQNRHHSTGNKLETQPPPPAPRPTQPPSSDATESYNTYPYNSYYYYETNDGAAAADFADNTMLPEHQNPYAFRPHAGFGMSPPTRVGQQQPPRQYATEYTVPPIAASSSSSSAFTVDTAPLESTGSGQRLVTSQWLDDQFWYDLSKLQVANNTDLTCSTTNYYNNNNAPQSTALLRDNASAAYRVCDAKSHKRRAVLKSVRLDFCNHWSLAHVFGHNDECVLRPSVSSSLLNEHSSSNFDDENGGGAGEFDHHANNNGGDGDCHECVQAALAADDVARKAWCYFSYNILGRYDCQTRYSVVWDCNACREAYKLWICAMLIPFHKREYIIRPCRTFCRWVEQRCPYLAPEEKYHQYGGEPAFRCRDPGIPELFSIYAPEPWCYLPCHLDHSLGPEGACTKVRLQYSQLAEYYNVSNLVRQKQAAAELAAAPSSLDNNENNRADDEVRDRKKRHFLSLTSSSCANFRSLFLRHSFSTIIIIIMFLWSVWNSLS